MKVGFGKDDVNPSSEVPSDDKAVATVPTSLPVAPYNDESLGLDDIILPRINIVQKVGGLSDTFDPGAILINAEQVIYTYNKDLKNPATPLKFLTIGFQPLRYAEKVAGGAKGKIVNRPEEVVALGGTLDYNDAKNNGKALFQRYATALILIEQPENVDDTHFPHEFGGKKYCTALWSSKGAAYTAGAKVLNTAKQIGPLRGPLGYRTAFYTMGTLLASHEGNAYFKPSLRPGEKTTEEFRAFVTGVVKF